MAKKKTRRLARKAPPLQESSQEMSALQVWLWVIGGMIALAIIFALIEVLAARFFG